MIERKGTSVENTKRGNQCNGGTEGARRSAANASQRGQQKNEKIKVFSVGERGKKATGGGWGDKGGHFLWHRQRKG